MTRHRIRFNLVIAIGVCALAAACSSGSAGSTTKEQGGTQAPQVPQTTTVLLLGQSKVALLNSATHAIVKTLDYQEQSPALEPGSWGDNLVAFVRTARGLTAYVLEYAQVVPIYLADDTIGQPIQLGGPTWAIAASPDGKTVYVASGPSGQDEEVTPIDTAVNGAGQPIPVGTDPDALAFGPGGKTLYVANTGDSTVTPIDVAAGTAGQPISFGQGDPSDVQMAVTPDGKTVYVLAPGQLIPIDATAGVAGTPIALRASPVPVAGATGTAGSAPPLGASPLVLSPNGTTLYDGWGEGKGWAAIDTATNTVSAYFAPSSGLSKLILAPDGRTLYGIDEFGHLTAIDTATGTVSLRASDGGGEGARDMAITPDGRTIFILQQQGDALVPFNTVTRTMGKPIKQPVDDSYEAIAVAP